VAESVCNLLYRPLLSGILKFNLEEVSNFMPVPRSPKGEIAVTLDQYITSVLTSIAEGINNSNAEFDEAEPVFSLAGGKEHFIEFQIAVELTKKTTGGATGKAGIKIPYLSVAAELSAHDTSEGAHRNIVKFKVLTNERAVFKKKTERA